MGAKTFSLTALGLTFFLGEPSQMQHTHPASTKPVSLKEQDSSIDTSAVAQ